MTETNLKGGGVSNQTPAPKAKIGFNGGISPGSLTGRPMVFSNSGPTQEEQDNEMFESIKKMSGSEYRRWLRTHREEFAAADRRRKARGV